MLKWAPWQPPAEKRDKLSYTSDGRPMPVYCMKSGKWQISKTFDKGEAKYVLWEGNIRHPATGCYLSSDDAKAVANELERRRSERGA
jgi:hypothetical protein